AGRHDGAARDLPRLRARGVAGRAPRRALLLHARLHRDAGARAGLCHAGRASHGARRAPRPRTRGAGHLHHGGVPPRDVGSAGAAAPAEPPSRRGGRAAPPAPPTPLAAGAILPLAGAVAPPLFYSRPLGAVVLLALVVGIVGVALLP